MSEREQLNATSAPMSKGENAKNDGVLRDDELEIVSGGYSFGASQTGTMVVRSFSIDIGTSEA